jgi:Spy/CpxP family protein refolding chaperone
MSKAGTTIIVGFALAMGAGVVVGVAAARHPQPVSADGFWLSNELHLSPQQHEQMRAIWSQVTDRTGPNFGERRRQLQKERDESIVQILTDEQKQRYDAAVQNYTAKLADLNKEREKTFQDAVARTKLILTDSQRQHYDEILKERGHGHWPGRPRLSPDSRPATRAVSAAHTSVQSSGKEG